MNLKALRDGYQEQPGGQSSAKSEAFRLSGKHAQQDKILQYGAQLNDIALQLQEWVTIYQSQESVEG